MMLIPLLLITSTLVPAQDDAAATTTAATVEAFMREVESKLYMPEREGLTSLSFDIRYEGPMYGPVTAVVHATWTPADGPVTRVELGDFEPPQQWVDQAGGDVAMVKAQMEQVLPLQFQGQTEVVVENVLNRAISSLLDEYVARIDGASEEGYVRIVFTGKPGADVDAPEQVLYVDDDSVLRRLESSQSMGDTVAPVKVEFTWREAGDDESGLVLEATTTTATIPTMMGDMQQVLTTEYAYVKVNGLVILEQVSTSVMGQNMVQKLENIVVNGKRAET